MPGLTNGLVIGLSGLRTHQEALNVIGHNITNVNTTGYSRQRANITSANAQAFGNFMFGAGSNLAQISSVRDKYLDLQITAAISRQKGSDMRFSTLEGVSPVFDGGSDASLDTLVQRFFQGFQDLSTRPEDLSVRTDLVSRANAMISGMQTRSKLLLDQRISADGSIDSFVTEVNALTKQIAALNLRVANEPTPGADNDARDQRTVVVNKLAELVGIQTFEDNHGLLQVLVDGAPAPLVAGTKSFDMTTTKDPLNNNFLKVEVQLGSPVDVTGLLRGGHLGAKLDLRDSILPGIQRRLDQLAAGVVGQVNLLHRAGFALNGVTTGTDFFLSGIPNGANGLPTSITAASNYSGMVSAMTVNAAVATDPRLIAAAAVAGAVGNNVQAKAMAALQFTSTTVDTNGDGVADSGPYSTYISSLIGFVGSQTQGYQSNATTEENLLEALQAQRDRVSGVDLDEEAATLLTMQRGYQASARFVSVIDQLTDQLVNQFGK